MFSPWVVPEAAFSPTEYGLLYCTEGMLSDLIHRAVHHPHRGAATRPGSVAGRRPGHGRVRQPVFDRSHARAGMGAGHAGRAG